MRAFQRQLLVQGKTFNWFVGVTLFKGLPGNEFGGFAMNLKTRFKLSFGFCMEGTQLESTYEWWCLWFSYDIDLVNGISELCTNIHTFHFTWGTLHLSPLYHPPKPEVVFTDTVVPGYMYIIIPNKPHIITTPFHIMVCYLRYSHLNHL